MSMDILMWKGKNSMWFHSQIKYLQATNDFWKKDNQPFPGSSPLLVVQCREVILEAIYTQKTKTVSQIYVYTYLCTYIHTYAHTYIWMFIIMIINEDKVIDLRVGENGKGWRKKRGGASDVTVLELKYYRYMLIYVQCCCIHKSQKLKIV